VAEDLGEQTLLVVGPGPLPAALVARQKRNKS
jgi:hypothetical protein